MWMTFKQALELGAAVRKGETGSTVVFASRFTKSESDGHGNEIDREIPFLKAYSVFDIEQIDGLPDRYYEQPVSVLDPVERMENTDRFFRNTGALIRHGGSQAYYSPVSDHIQMPPFETFRDATGYVATLSHEATHWTAHPDRVGRDLSRYAKDRSERAREELIAELNSCSSAPISASSRNWSRDPITPPICSPGSASCQTTSARSSRPRHMRSAL